MTPKQIHPAKLSPTSKRRRRRGPAESRPRVLRVGLVLGDRLIEERLVRTAKTLTVGQSISNDFSVPIEGLPKTFSVFEKSATGYVLRFTKEMTGRLSKSSGLCTLAQLRSAGATRKSEYWEIALDTQSRGKVSLGPMTLLFQFVAAPPLSPAPALPASMQRSLVSRIEPKLALILACSVFAHFSLALWAYTRDQILQEPVERIAHSFQVGQYEMPEQTPYEPTLPESGESKAGAGAELAVQTPTTVQPRVRERVAPKERGPSDNGEPKVAESIQKSAIISVLSGKEGESSLFQAMTNTDQGASLDKSLQHITGAATVTRGDTPRRHRENPEAQIGTGEKVGVTGPGPATTLTPKGEESVTRFPPATQMGVSDLDPTEVVKRIRSRYLNGIKRCHQRALKYDPKAKGRVAIRLTVGPTGRVTKAAAKGFSPEVDSCITGQAAKWRFSAPKDEGLRTSADFEVPLLLKPGR